MQFNVPASLLVLITYSWIRKKLPKTKAAAASARSAENSKWIVPDMVYNPKILSENPA